jgi:SAM-dependent methyltransferase
MAQGLEQEKTFVLDTEVLNVIDVPHLPMTGERQVALNRADIAPDHRKRYEWAAERLLKSIGPGKRVLDAACGVGYGAQILAEAGFVVTAIDIVPQVIEVASQAYKHENLTYRCADLETADLGEFDAVVSFETLEHIPDAPLVVERFRRAAPVLIASVPNETVLPFEKSKWPFHLRHYTPDEFAQLLNGYQIAEWMTQHDKWVGTIVPGNDGRFHIVEARR